MTINLHLPSHSETLKPKITVIGVGGAGGNAVNNMIAANLEGVDFVMANTDAQALEGALTDRTIQLGVTVTRGLGAGANPQIGQAAAEEALGDIADHISGSNMVFITAGMGGGTGTGAAPVIAQLAREQGILTVGVVTKPFHFEGTHRMKMADRGIEDLQKYVDTLIVIPNQNLFRIANEKTTMADAFRMADEVLHSGVRGVTDLMVKPGLVNLDFADIRAVMCEMGKAMMGTGEAIGDKRAIEAAESAISNPLLDDVSLKGAKAVLINITGGPDMTLFEVDEAANRIRDEVDPEANIIFGSTFSDALEGKMRVSVVATGIDYPSMQSAEDPERMRQHGIGNRMMTQAPKPIIAPAAQPAAQQASVPNFGSKPTSSYINLQPRSEFKRERTPAEIVRESGTTSALELARLANLKAKEEADRARAHEERNKPEPYQPSMFEASAAHAAQHELSTDEPLLELDESNKPRPFRLGAVKEQVGGSPFMAARPEHPAQRTHFVSNPMGDEEMMDDEADMEFEGEDESPAAPGLSFFQRIAGVGKSITSGNREARADAVVREVSAGGGTRAAIKEAPQPDPEEDEYLDIPAFLRRQAN